MSCLFLWSHISSSGILQTYLLLLSIPMGKCPFFNVRIFLSDSYSADAVCDKPVVDGVLGVLSPRADRAVFVN